MNYGKKLTLKFKNQQFQTDAARAVTDVFRGQRNQSMVEFTHDMGRSSDGSQDLFDVVGFRNQPLTVPAGQILETSDRYKWRHNCGHRKQ